MSKKSAKVQSVAQEAQAESFCIERPQRATLAFEIRGRSAYIQNCFSQKAIEEMLRKHMGLTVQREKKNPRQLIENATIRNINGDVCIPPVGIKCAMLTAAGGLKTFQRAKTQLKTGLFIMGQSLPLSYKEMRPRMDMVRTSGMTRVPDVRFRPSFLGWSTKLVIQYNDSFLQPQSVADLLMRAGDVGIGEWRPERGGVYGTFDVARAISSSKEALDVEVASAVALKTPEIPQWAIDAEIDRELLSKLFDGGDEAPSESEKELETVEE